MVELSGAPGSGKSTLVRWLSGRAVIGPAGVRRRLVPADLLSLHPRPAFRGLSRTLGRPDVMGLLARHPSLRAAMLTDAHGPTTDVPSAAVLPEGWEALFRSAGASGADDPRGDAEYRARARTWVLATHRSSRAGLEAPDGLLPILDEGTVQRSLTVLGSTAGAGSAEAVHGLLAPGTLVVHLAVPDEVLVERALRRREHGEAPELHRSMTTSQIADTVRSDAVALSGVVDGLERLGIEVVRVTQRSGGGRSAGPGQAGREILRFLARGRPAP